MSGELPLECTHLARELAGLRASTGLSLAGLAARTTASKSSWQRYLGGTQIPPPELVTELCALAGEPPARLLALRELAELSRRHPQPRRPREEPRPRPARESSRRGPAHRGTPAHRALRAAPGRIGTRPQEGTTGQPGARAPWCPSTATGR
ncbi:helix-turn-helix domain-containing protein, partial [Streptomyces albidoflavus]|uniref:helix-turn-helix domain-containing protein n=1 Tax=Streptomyces albidoflavus TaxID=1886 RepID=UPI00211C46DD